MEKIVYTRKENPETLQFIDVIVAEKEDIKKRVDELKDKFNELKAEKKANSKKLWDYFEENTDIDPELNLNMEIINPDTIVIGLAEESGFSEILKDLLKDMPDSIKSALDKTDCHDDDCPVHGKRFEIPGT